MTMLGFAAAAFSAIFIVVLGREDPKRRRTARLPGKGQSATMRRLLVAITCLPGLWCALIGDAAAFLIWLGGCAVGGWFVALWFGRTRKGVN